MPHPHNAHLVLGSNLPHAARGNVHVLAQPPEARLAHDLHREASPRGLDAVAYAPFAQVHPAVRAPPDLPEEDVDFVDRLLALVVLAPPGVVGEEAVPLLLFCSLLFHHGDVGRMGVLHSIILVPE